MCSTRAKGPLVEIDDDDLPKEAVEESSSEAEDADAGAYELVKHG